MSKIINRITSNRLDVANHLISLVFLHSFAEFAVIMNALLKVDQSLFSVVEATLCSQPGHYFFLVTANSEMQSPSVADINYSN